MDLSTSHRAGGIKATNSRLDKRQSYKIGMLGQRISQLHTRKTSGNREFLHRFSPKKRAPNNVIEFLLPA